MKYKQRIEVASRTEPDKVYAVTEGVDGLWRCGCKGWIFKYRKLGLHCDHIRFVLNDLKPAVTAPQGNDNERERAIACLLQNGFTWTVINRLLTPGVATVSPPVSDFVIVQRRRAIDLEA